LSNIHTAYAVFASNTVFGKPAVCAIETVLTIGAVVAFYAIYTFVHKLGLVAVVTVGNICVMEDTVAVETKFIVVRFCNHVAIFYIPRAVYIFTILQSFRADKHSLARNAIQKLLKLLKEGLIKIVVTFMVQFTPFVRYPFVGMIDGERSVGIWR